MGALPEGGAMAAIEATEQEIAESIAGKEAELSIAAINGPTSTVISGSRGGGRRGPHRVGGAGPEDQAPRRLPRLPLAADRADAGGVRRGRREPRLQRAPDPDRLQRHRRAAQPRAGHRPRLLGRATCASRCASPTRSRPSTEQGATTYLELGPDPVLCAMARESPRRGGPRPPSSRPCARVAPRPMRSRPRSPAPTPPGPSSTGRPSSGRRRQARPAAHLSLPARALLARLDRTALGTSAPPA